MLHSFLPHWSSKESEHILVYCRPYDICGDSGSAYRLDFKVYNQGIGKIFKQILIIRNLIV